MPYFTCMGSKTERMILSFIKDFFNSKEAKELSSKDKKLGSKIRMYKSREKKGNLTVGAAISLIVECDMIDKLKFKDVEVEK